MAVFSFLFFYGYVVRNRRFPTRLFGSWCTRRNAQCCTSFARMFYMGFFCCRLAPVECFGLFVVLLVVEDVFFDFS